jgi:hypothetical protein
MDTNATPDGIANVETMAKWVKFMLSNSNQIQNDYSFNSTPHLQALIQAHAQWIKGFLDAGWDGYLFSVMFHQLAGSRKTMIVQMQQELERVYNRLVTSMVRKPRSPRWAGYLPVGLFVPDLPVPKIRKGKKSTIADVSMNDGLHMGGIVFGNKWGRVRTGLEKHFKEEKDKYVTGKIRKIDIERITHNLDDVVDYTFKSLKRRTSSPDDVLVLNWGGSAGRPSIWKEMIRKALGRDRTIWDVRHNGAISTLLHV